MLAQKQNLADVSKQKKLAKPVTKFYTPDLAKYERKLSISVKKNEAVAKTITIRKMVLSQRRLDSKEIMNQNVEIMQAMFSAEAASDSETKKKRTIEALKRTYFIPPEPIPFADVPSYSRVYIDQYVTELLEQAKRDELQIKKIKRVAIKFIALSVFTGAPVITAVSLVLNPKTAKNILGILLPDSWINFINENKTTIAYHAIMTMVPFVVQEPTQYILSSVVSNYYVRMHLTSNITQAGTYLTNSPFVGNVFSNVAYSTLSEMAVSGKSFLLSIKSPEELRADLMEKVYLEKLAHDAKLEKIAALLEKGLTGEALSKAIKADGKDTIHGRILYYLKKATVGTAQMIMRNKGKALLLCFAAGITYYIWDYIVTIVDFFLPTILDTFAFMSDATEKVYEAFTRGITKQDVVSGFDSVVSWLKTIFPPSTTSKRISAMITHRFFPWILTYFMNAMKLPARVNAFFSKYPMLRKKLGSVAGLKQLKAILSKFYGKEIEWNIAVHTVLTQIFIKANVATMSQFVDQYMPKDMFRGILEKLDLSTVTIFISSCTKTFKSMYGGEEDLNKLWDNFSLKDFFPQFYESTKFMIQGTILYDGNNQKAFVIDSFDNFYINVLGLGDNAGKSKQIDLVSSSDFFSYYKIHNDVTGTKEPIGLQQLVQGSMNNIIHTILKEDGKGGEIERSKLKNLFETATYNQNENLLEKLKNAGLDSTDEVSRDVLKRIKAINSISSGLSEKEKVNYNFSKEAIPRIEKQIGIFNEYKNLGRYNEIISTQEMSAMKTYDSEEEKLKEVNSIITLLEEQIGGHKTLISGIDIATGVFNGLVTEEKDKLRANIISWLEIGDSYVERKKKGLVLNATDKFPTLDLRATDSGIAKLKEISAKNTQYFKEEFATANDSFIKSQQKSQQYARNDLRDPLIQRSIETREKIKVEFHQKLNDTVMRVGVQNMMNFALGNAMAVDLTLLLGLMQKFSDSGILSLDDIPPGINFDNLKELLDGANARQKLIDDLMKNAPKDLKEKCADTTAYSWDLATGRPKNANTQELDDSFAPCYVNSGSINVYNTIRTTGKASLTTLGIATGGYGFALLTVFSIIMAMGDTIPLWYGRFNKEKADEETSIQMAIRLFTDIICITKPISFTDLNCTSYRNAALAQNGSFQPMTPASKIRLADFMWQTTDVASKDPKVVLVFEKIIRATFGVSKSAEEQLEDIAEQRDNLEYLKGLKDAADKEKIEFQRRKDAGEFGVELKEDASYFDKIRALSYAPIGYTKEVLHQKEMEQKIDDEEDRLDRIKAKKLDERMFARMAKEYINYEQKTKPGDRKLKEIWERDWFEREKSLNNGLTWDDISYILTGPHVEAMGMDLIFGSPLSSSTRIIFDRWYQLRRQEMHAAIYTQPNHEELLKKFHKEKSYGLTSEYINDVAETLGGVATFGEWLAAAAATYSGAT